MIFLKKHVEQCFIGDCSFQAAAFMKGLFHPLFHHVSNFHPVCSSRHVECSSTRSNHLFPFGPHVTSCSALLLTCLCSLLGLSGVCLARGVKQMCCFAPFIGDICELLCSAVLWPVVVALCRLVTPLSLSDMSGLVLLWALGSLNASWLSCYNFSWNWIAFLLLSLCFDITSFTFFLQHQWDHPHPLC